MEIFKSCDSSTGEPIGKCKEPVTDHEVGGNQGLVQLDGNQKLPGNDGNDFLHIISVRGKHKVVCAHLRV